MARAPRPAAARRAPLDGRAAGRGRADDHAPTGIGGLEALQVFADVLAPACISVDHPRFLSFVPAAPTEAAILFDLVVGASSIYGGSWLEGGGAIYAENEALRWIADLAGLPADGRRGVRQRRHGRQPQRADRGPLALAPPRPAGGIDRTRGLIVAVRRRPLVGRLGGAGDGRRRRRRARRRRRSHDRATRSRRRSARSPTDDRDRLFAIVATAGTTNAGVIDDLAGDGRGVRRASARGCTSTVPTAAPPSPRRACAHRFAGVERADSFIVDPHKWLFAPFDSCALLYRDPEIARRAHTQHAEYLDVLHADTATARAEWNASRLRPPPLPPGPWPAAVVQPRHPRHRRLRRGRRDDAARRPRGRRARATPPPHLELLIEPELSIVLFRRVGWDAATYQAWSDEQLATEQSFVTPTAWNGETVLRWCIVNPLTTVDDLPAIVDSLETFGG